MASADLGDRRLNKRLAQILSDLGERPTASIPEACGGHAEMTAAYRFFDNDKVTFEKVLQPHFEKSRERIAAQPVVLLVQDTTEVDLTRPRMSVAGAGPLDASARRGVFLHVLEAFTEDGTPLGAIWAKAWAREDEPEVTRVQKRAGRKAGPIEAKESIRWIEGLRRAREVAAVAPGTTCVCVGDSESDIYEFFAESRRTEAGGRVEWLVRACQDRRLVKPGAAAEATLLRQAVSAAPELFTHEISVRGRSPKIPGKDRARRRPRRDRRAVVTARATSVTLRPPWRAGRRLQAVTAHVVLVREEDPPEQEEPIEWLLVTTLPIDDAEQVRAVIAYYATRWMIEVLFRTLKSGCRVEERRFEHIDRLLPSAAVYLIIAWRTLLVCRLARSCPEISCEAIFEPTEWKAVCVALHRRAPPSKPPRLGEVVRLIAQLGGYVNRPGRKDPPGVQTVWQGLQRMHDLAWAWSAFGPEASKKLV